MSESRDELLSIVDTMNQLAKRGRQEESWQPIQRLKQAAEQVGKAWSGSWIGYHANVYYRNLQPTPPGMRFSQEWGGLTGRFETHSEGDWVEYAPEEVIETIYKLAGNPDITPANTFSENVHSIFQEHKLTILSIIDVELHSSDSQFLSELKEKVNVLSLWNEDYLVSSWAPRTIWSKDNIAMQQGIHTPPHMLVLANVSAIECSLKVLTDAEVLAKQAVRHISRQGNQLQPSLAVGRRVFVGHGSSLVWLELKGFIEDRLKLLVDEFNRVPIAGVPNIQRLSDMLDAATVAFLIMTGEDEQLDGQIRARENVVHEAGLFQGRLGFRRAIVLLEEGCQEFSNIAGLGQIRFPKGNISSAFEEVRMVLEREDVLTG